MLERPPALHLTVSVKMVRTANTPKPKSSCSQVKPQLKEKSNSGVPYDWLKYKGVDWRGEICGCLAEKCRRKTPEEDLEERAAKEQETGTGKGKNAKGGCR